jgi:hypothetical protein
MIAAVTFGWFAWRLDQGVAMEIVRTETFTVLAMCQWFNVLNCQSARPRRWARASCATAGCSAGCRCR